jgi:hypothetical protein
MRGGSLSTIHPRYSFSVPMRTDIKCSGLRCIDFAEGSHSSAVLSILLHPRIGTMLTFFSLNF